MRALNTFMVLMIATLLVSCSQPQPGKHLFILSGQSNMAGMDPDESFIPSIEAEFGAENVIVVKDAKGGQPIRRWFKDYNPTMETEGKNHPIMYDSLMNKLNPAIENEKFASISFIWMQGERDAREQLGEVYEDQLKKLYMQTCVDLGRNYIFFIIGRLSDFDMENEKYPHWTMIREIQVEVAESDSKFAWVDTDDLNDGYNRQGKPIADDLHMSAEGYNTLGSRFAEKAIEFIRKNN